MRNPLDGYYRSGLGTRGQGIHHSLWIFIKIQQSMSAHVLQNIWQAFHDGQSLGRKVTHTGKIGRNEEKKRAAEKRRFFIGRLMGGK